MNNPYKIIFIDDDDVTNFLTREALKRKGFQGETVFFESATKALEYLENLDLSHHPDVIFLDIKMPEMDGFDFLDEYIKNGLDKKINAKIFMLTSSVSSADIEKSNTYDVVSGFLNKPFSYDLLKNIEV